VILRMTEDHRLETPPTSHCLQLLGYNDHVEQPSCVIVLVDRAHRVEDLERATKVQYFDIIEGENADRF